MAGGKADTGAAPRGGAACDTPKQDGKPSDPPRPPGSPSTIEKWGR